MTMRKINRGNNLWACARAGFVRIFEGLVRWVIVANLVGIMVIVGLQVLHRFAPKVIPNVADEILQLSVVWMVFLGAGFLQKEDGHLRIEWFEQRCIKTRIASILYALTKTSVELLFVGFFFYSALRLYCASHTAVTHTLRLPMQWWYLSLLFSGGLLGLYSVLNALNKVRKRERRQ